MKSFECCQICGRCFPKPRKKPLCYGCFSKEGHLQKTVSDYWCEKPKDKAGLDDFSIQKRA